VTLSDWAPGKPFPKPAEDAARFPPWKTSALDVDEDWSLWDYDVVFCEVAYEKVYAGPQVVQKLRSFFERTHRPDRDGTRPSYTFGIGHSTRNEIIAADRMPAIIVLTRSANFNFIHQCLSLGAHAYVAKDRLFEIPFRLWAAVRDEEFAALHRAQSYIAGSGKERMGHRSNFRNLYSLHGSPNFSGPTGSI
jgi:CheY-like chemotaxis protein